VTRSFSNTSGKQLDDEPEDEFETAVRKHKQSSGLFTHPASETLLLK
jgi:hypothetical protein